MQSLQYRANYSCPSISNVVHPAGPTREIKRADPSSKYYREIGAEMVGNRLTIRMERDKNRAGRGRDKWDPPCDCDTVEIQRPTRTQGPKLLSRNDNNRILFRIHSKGSLNVKDDPSYKPQAISYEVGPCKDLAGTGGQCRRITVHPQLGAPGTQEVHTDTIQDGEHNLFFLRVKRNPDTADQRTKKNIELEVRTPRPPSPPPDKSNPESSTRPILGPQRTMGRSLQEGTKKTPLMKTP